MIPTHLSVEGITVYREPTEVDLAGLGAGLIGVTGRKGAGKTTLLECILVALYHRSPSYGSIRDLISPGAKLARIELEFTTSPGRSYCSTLQYEPGFANGRGKTEAYLYYQDQEELAGPNLAEHKAAILKLVPSEDLALASSFAVQSSEGSLLDAPKGKRKEMLIELLGLGWLAALAAKAGDHLKAVTDTCLSLEMTAGSAEELGITVDRLVGECGEAESQLAQADQELTEVLTALEDAQGQLSAARERVAAEEALAKEHGVPSRALPAAQDRLKRALETVDRYDQLIVDRPLIERAYEEVRAAAQRRPALEKAVVETEARATAVGALEFAARERVAKLVRLNEKIALQEEGIADVERRAAVLAQGVDMTRTICQSCPLTSDIRREELRLPKLRAALARVVQERTTLEAEIAANPSRADALSRATAAVQEAREAVRANEPFPETKNTANRWLALQEALTYFADATAAVEAARAEIAELEKRTRLIDQRQAGLPQAKRDLAAVLGRTVVLEDRVKDHRTRRELLAGELQMLRGRCLESRQQLARAEDAARKLTAATQKRTVWETLTRGLGKDGIQALELDAAGPEIATLTNQLLEATDGPRWSIAFETVADKKDGGQKEVFEIRILDAESGRTATTVSGGERVVIEEALRNAIAITVKRRSPQALDILVRDESAKHLDDESADQYVEMLRKSLEIGGFHAAYVISHQPNVQKACDARLACAGGKVTPA